MSREPISRRQFVTAPLALLLAPWPAFGAEIRSGRAPSEVGDAAAGARRGSYAVDVGILYNVYTLRMTGAIDETVDRTAGRYIVTAVGGGSGLANRIESTGRVVDGRWAPLRTTAWFEVRGRESRSDMVYDYAHRAVEYHLRAETFFLRRQRVVDDRVAMPDGVHVDDVLSAILNLANGSWKPQPDGVYRTWVVRRHRREGEGPDDVDRQPHAEIVPFDLRLTTDEATGKETALFDMTRFSSWATKERPARIVLGSDRRPELITTPLMLGTSVTIRLKDV
jgi:hypothetical protein